MENIRFDDVEKLRSKVSDEFSPWSKPIQVTQEKINQFADVTGDHQWIQIDSGWKVTGYRNVVNYGANKLRFISPVPAGSAVHGRQRVVAVEPRPQGTQVTVETQVHVVGQDKPALIYEGIFLYVK